MNFTPFNDTVTPSREEYYTSQGAREFLTPSALYKDYMQMYLPNAYNTALFNYMNEYNLPVNQMLRYQDAGINPYSAIGNIKADSASPVAGGATPSFSGTAQSQKDFSNLLQSIGMVTNVTQAAAQVYDYLKFGVPTHEANLKAARYQADIKGLDYLWQNWWNTGIDSTVAEGTPSDHRFAGVVESSPRARYMTASTDEKLQHIEQLKSLCDVLYPSQQEANKAKADLDNYKREVMKGGNDAILNVNTGNETRDQWLKLIFYFFGNHL